MKKSPILFVTMFLLVVFLTACGNSAIQSTGSSNEQPSNNGTNEETDEQGVVKIGSILPFSGVYASLGKDLSDGMKLYFDQVDWEAGGVKIEMIEEDTEADPQVALRKLRKLMDQDQIDILTGAVSTAVAYAVRDEVDSNQLPYLASHAGGNDLTRAQRSDYIWRSSFSSWQIGHSMGAWAYENIGEKIYMAAADYAFGREVSAAFKEAYEAAGGEIVGEVYPPLGNNDYASYLTTIGSAEADGVYGFFAGSDAVRFVQQYEQYGLKERFPLIGSGWLVAEDLRESIGMAAEGAFVSTFWDYNLETAENEEFVTAYEEAYDRRPTIESLEGYDAARIIVEALTALDGDVQDPDKIVEAISEVEFVSPRGPIKFDQDTHHIIQNLYITETVVEGDRTENKILETVESVQDPGE
ncbi:ABC transporter substrate-binding protein [Alkalihalobacillus alcalophilus ATCC 27647 = CGMCC 1.3604]|uniref:ABC transporter substrate-binding protein n=1 Tax=Alkalihalobacillus alcalophilus ATCC 27647 = CGMCC 1.3604 TaxID=1218173 RepID=J8Q3W5_ALKAL|nr:ABC transporter substrate-binding protein [Alkalihalobacillus alcalophilus]AFV25994.1 branched-chain amino acid transporter [Alkalihalobacillus alcalophilus ATCC 27647 = CGMCC 1.3604]KGA95520.1 ABC transporter substrate-binding protein [Alkalihalobacillus alcalophilus ATCC 27647 = CGMCC 1.3604]MED1564007.1 ABC transporter substrate-binding protein [Alkalihalobacillus alcalophilus]THG91229.1 ABC transporter substrate-binding protein [Alkalihalobacillus alcalophilus ATCC 27647 = CGMCC 1.3604]